MNHLYPEGDANNGLYQYITRDTFIQFDGTNAVSLSTLKSDSLGTSLTPTNEKTDALTPLKAIIQSYMRRMTNNELVIATNE